MKSQLARPGNFGNDQHTQALADALALVNERRFREAKMQVRYCMDPKKFLEKLAAHPEHLPKGFAGCLPQIPLVSDLFDHPLFYYRDRRPFAAIFHSYARLTWERLQALVIWGVEVGLQVLVDADSEYYPGVTLRIVLCRIGEKFPHADLV